MKKIMLVLVTLFGVAFMATPTLVLAEPDATGAAGAAGAAAGAAIQSNQTSATKSAVCDGLSQVGGGSCDPNAPGQTNIGDTIKKGISILSIIVGVAAVIMIIIGGFRYVISGGDSGSVSSAKSTILYAVIGLVVAALAQIIVQFVLKNLP